MMKSNELRGKTAKELTQELRELSKEQFNLRMQKGVGQIPRPHAFKRIRREIARIKTILNEKAKTE